MVDDEAHPAQPGIAPPGVRDEGTRHVRVSLPERLRRRSPEPMRRLSPDAWTTMLVAIGVIGGLALGFLLGSIPGALDRTVTTVARPAPTSAPAPTVTVTETYMLPPSPPALAAREEPDVGPADVGAPDATTSDPRTSDPRTSESGTGDPRPSESTTSGPGPTESGTSAPPEGGRPGVRTHWETGGLGGNYGHVGTLTASTTQGFARNVARAYNASGAAGRTRQVTATSDATGSRITMTCSPQGNGSVVCRGGRNARIVLWR